MADGRFKKGHPGYKPKGAKSEKVKLWNELKDFILSEGAEKFMEEMKNLKGQKYTDTFLKALEYFQPKLTRSEIDHSTTVNVSVSKEEAREISRALEDDY